MMNRQTLQPSSSFHHIWALFFFVENSTCGIFATEGGGVVVSNKHPTFFFLFAHPVRAEFFAGFFCQTQQ